MTKFSFSKRIQLVYQNKLRTKNVSFLNICLTLFGFLILPISYAQTTTVTLLPSDERMVNYSTSIGGGGPTYSGSESVDILSYSSDYGGTDVDAAKFRFDHPSFVNNKITKVVLGVQYRKWESGDAISHVLMPKHVHNNAVAWSGFSFQQPRMCS